MGGRGRIQQEDDAMSFKVGDTIWMSTNGNREVEKTCPVCFGKMRVTLILGNDDRVELPCDYCGKGWDGPKGYVTEYEYVTKAEPFIIGAIETTVTETGATYKYRECRGWSCDTDRLFATEAEALDDSQKRKAAYDVEQQTRAEYIKEKTNKSYSWNAGYHMRTAKRHRSDAEYHESRAMICKARAKEDDKC